MKVTDFYTKELLRKASLSLVLQRFAGKTKLRKYNWFIRFLRWVLMMEPEYDSVLPPLSKGNKIKFRRYESLSESMQYTETEFENKYYLGGKEITSIEKNKILSRKKGKLIRCPDTLCGESSGSPIAMITDHFNVKDGSLDITDPLLVKCLKEIDLPIEKTLIVQVFRESKDPLSDAQKGAVYGYWQL